MIPPDKSHAEGELVIFNPQGKERYRAIYDLIYREGQWLARPCVLVQQYLKS